MCPSCCPAGLRHRQFIEQVQAMARGGMVPVSGCDGLGVRVRVRAPCKCDGSSSVSDELVWGGVPEQGIWSCVPGTTTVTGRIAGNNRDTDTCVPWQMGRRRRRRRGPRSRGDRGALSPVAGAGFATRTLQDPDRTSQSSTSSGTASVGTLVGTRVRLVWEGFTGSGFTYRVKPFCKSG